MPVVWIPLKKVFLRLLNDKKNELVKAGRKVYNMSVGTLISNRPSILWMQSVKLLQSLRITNTH